MSIVPVLTQLCIRFVKNDGLEIVGNGCFLLSILLLWWALRGGKTISAHPSDVKDTSNPYNPLSTISGRSSATSQRQYADTPQNTDLSRNWGSSGGSPNTDHDGYDSAMSSDGYASPTQLFKVRNHLPVIISTYV